MKPKPIGIIGGAGPLAGAFLLERIFSLSTKIYGCYRDADFPQVFLISFPFSEMLSPNADAALLRKELRDCLNALRKQGASILAIACNTLHAFLEEKDLLDDFVHLPQVLEEERLSDFPLVLCSSTSARLKLHKKFIRCSYPDGKTQREIDALIDQVLQGADRFMIIQKLQALIAKQNADTLVLGCTELSLFADQLSVAGKAIIDPLEIAAKKIVEKSFSIGD